MVIDVLLRKTKAKLEENKKIKDCFLRNGKRDAVNLRNLKEGSWQIYVTTIRKWGIFCCW